jgi:hypothetical protein
VAVFSAKEILIIENVIRYQEEGEVFLALQNT